LGVVVEVPGGAGEGAAGWEFEENSVDHAVLIVFGLVGQAGYESVYDEGEEKMLVVNVVQREHGAAVEQELGGERLEAEVFERNTERGLGFCGEDRDGGEKKKAGQGGAKEGGAGRSRDGGVGNQHGNRRVSHFIDRA
jgi:hypothetical protein